MILIPDQHHREVFERDIKPGLAAGKMLMTAHGFSLHYSQVIPPPDIDVAMVAPKSPGHMMRRLFVEGVGVPALWAVHQDATGSPDPLTLPYPPPLDSPPPPILPTTT